MSETSWMKPSPERDHAVVRIAMGNRPWHHAAVFGVDTDVERAMDFHTWRNHFDSIVRKRATEYAVARARSLLGGGDHHG